ncbi:MAG TPA: alpha/beta hydrolase [Solirubrobacteraceae bacterium]|jgi:pimeloyl-ACP methyl ester carboxylesterase
MQSFQSADGLRMAYQCWGEPSSFPPVVLHHGFVADANANWVATGVVEALLAAGHHVIAPDARGHGRSEKPHDPSRYGEQRMAADLERLLEALEIEQIDLAGYSMGAIVSLLFASSHGCVRRLVVGGVGSGVIECGGVDRRAVPNAEIIKALQADDPTTCSMPQAQAFRMLADALGADRQALAAQATSVYRGEIPLERITAATLILAGERDPLAVRPEVLAEAIAGAELRILNGENIEVLGDPRFAQSIVEHFS